MSKITIAGDAVVVTSALKLEDIKTIKKYRPKELQLMGGEDGKELVFAIGVSNGAGSINSVGVSFGRESNDGSKLATVTTTLPANVGAADIKEYVSDYLGAAIANMNKLEEKLPAVLEAIKTEKASLMESITVAQ